MISGSLAQGLYDAGVRWRPQHGDWFCLDTSDVDPWLIAPGAIELGTHDGATVLMFHGASEWAMDAVHAVDATWLPSETQVRNLLLEHAGAGVVVHLEARHEGVRCRVQIEDWLYESSAVLAVDAYASVLLAVLQRERA
ncbi:MAG: hypothetical protein RLY87_2790 [Chloroflexota bacterium]